MKAVLFDLDGTLADPREELESAGAEWFAHSPADVAPIALGDAAAPPGEPRGR